MEFCPFLGLAGVIFKLKHIQGQSPKMRVWLQLRKHSWKSSLGWAVFDQEALFILQYKHGKDLFSEGVASRGSRYACPEPQCWEVGRLSRWPPGLLVFTCWCLVWVVLYGFGP